MCWIFFLFSVSLIQSSEYSPNRKLFLWKHIDSSSVLQCTGEIVSAWMGPDTVRWHVQWLLYQHFSFLMPGDCLHSSLCLPHPSRSALISLYPRPCNVTLSSVLPAFFIWELQGCRTNQLADDLQGVKFYTRKETYGNKMILDYRVGSGEKVTISEESATVFSWKVGTI